MTDVISLSVENDDSRQTYAYECAEVLVGRSTNAQLVLPAASVSSRHGRFFCKDGALFYQDLFSTNGSALRRADGSVVYMKGPVRNPEPVGEEDCLEIEGFVLRAKMLSEDSTPEWTLTSSMVLNLDTAGEKIEKPDEALRHLHRFLLKTPSAQDNDAVLRQLVKAVARIFSALGELVFFDSADDLRPTMAWDAGGAPVEPPALWTESSIAQESLARKEGCLMQSDGAADQGPAAAGSSAMAVPLWLQGEESWGVLVVAAPPGGTPFTREDLRLLTILAFTASATATRVRLAGELRDAFETTVRAMLDALDMRDPTASGHSVRVQAIAMRIAEEMNLPDDVREVVRYAALLHDLGKLGIEERILNKDGRLTDEERAKIDEHTANTEALLRKIKFPSHLRRVPMVAAAHH